MVRLAALPHEVAGLYAVAMASRSRRPSQSLSRPSQISVDGLTLRLHTMLPPEHAVVPAAHTPCWPVEHARPPPGLPSSTWPLQLLSRLSQTSDVGPWLRLHTIEPPEHAVVPAAHWPSWPVEHARPPPGLPSST